MEKQIRISLVPLILVALSSMVFAGWIGLARMGWPIPSGASVIVHGPLMILGFFGTLISVERAVALQKWWCYPGPALAALGALMLMFGSPEIAAALLALSSLLFALVSVVMAWRHRALYAAILAVGALLWLLGTGLWLVGWPVFRVAHLWIAFLVITIAGERLELARLIRITNRGKLLLAVVLAGLLAGLIASLLDRPAGIRIIGAGYAGLAGWLFYYDVARRTVRLQGLTRYIAVCLLGGYGWLAAGGAALLIGGDARAGLLYDAQIHSILLGFIMSMLFGHFPIILPALLKRTISYFPLMYAPLAFLYISILWRVLSDYLNFPVGRQWGGLLNGFAILFFLGLMANAVRQSQPSESGPAMGSAR